jgi:hypothetical protein
MSLFEGKTVEFKYVNHRSDAAVAQLTRREEMSVTSYKLQDLPQVVHQLQILILGSMIEKSFERRFLGQKMDPAEARVQAMHMNGFPTGPEDERKAKEAYHAAIRVWQASKTLGLTWHEQQRLDAQTLIRAGL